MGTIGRVAGIRRPCADVAATCAAVLLTLSLTAARPGVAAEPTPPSPTPDACPPAQLQPQPRSSPPPTPSLSTPTTARSTGPYRPSPEEVVACIGSQEISGATFAHWATVAERSEGKSHRKPGSEPNRSQMLQVMGFLISADWVLGEAAYLHVVVSATEVRHHFDHLRHVQFPKRKEFQAFLGQTGETTADLLLRVRLNLASARIQKRVVGHSHGAHRTQRLLTRFVQHFRKRWSTQTYCESRYAVPDCGHTSNTL